MHSRRWIPKSNGGWIYVIFRTELPKKVFFTYRPIYIIAIG